MVLHIRELTSIEEDQLQSWLSGDDPVMRHRARVVLLSREGYCVPEIGYITRSHPANLRKWIHRFNDDGCAGLRPPKSGGPKRRFSCGQRSEIVALAGTDPRDLGLPFSRWTLHRLASQAAERGIVDRISHESVRQILAEAGCEHRRDRRRIVD